jgi:SAM-dependent methyltransferase
MEKYFDGKSLYGDDFSKEEIAEWYEQEAEAYANLGGKSADTNKQLYKYHNFNKLYGYKYLGNRTFTNVLGFGASYGYEFLPIIDKITNLTIIEPSSQTVSLMLGNIKPVYVKPNMYGNIDFPDDTFDLITCLSTLHHIPNVSFVLSELFRVLKPGGYLLLREPINSMGDWKTKRPGLTANERGIPKDYLSGIIQKARVQIVKRHYYACMTSFLQRLFKSFSFTSNAYLYFDKYFSKIFTFNIHYHPENKIQRISPSSVFYVLKKI